MNLKILSLLFLLILPFVSFSQFYDDWELQNPYPTANLLSDISFVNDSTGWIVGERGTILRTTDGGQTWDIQQSGTRLWLMNVSFTDENTGFASGNNSMVVYTLNGGETWNRMPGFQWYSDPLKSIFVINPDTVWFGSWNGQIYGCFNYGDTWIRVPPGGYNLEINSIWFPDSQTGIAAGGTYSGTERFFKVSNDAGQSWQNQAVNDSIGMVVDMVFASADTGYLLAEKYMTPNYVFKTVDKGVTWHPVYQIMGNNWKKLFFINAHTGYALANGRLYKTTDGGYSWQPLSYFGYAVGDYTDLYFSSESTGYICAYTGEILKTVDGGETWISLSEGYHETIFSVAFTDKQTGWAISQNLLLHTTDGDEHWNKYDSISIFGGRKVVFADENHGWLLNNYGYELYKTVDGGEHWTLLGGIDGLGYDLYFSDTLNGWFINHDNKLYGTHDGGATWTKAVLLEYLDVKDVVAENDNVWIVCENGNNYNAELYRSTDNGITWRKQYGDFGIFNVMRIRRTDDGTMFILGENSKIFKSNDDGDDWELINDQNFGLTDIFAVTSENIYAINSVSELVYTTNGGDVWNVSETAYGGFKDLWFFDDQGWTAGENGVIARVNTLTLSSGSKSVVNDKPVSVYPNPGKDVINVKSEVNTAYFEMFSTGGNNVFKEKIIKGNNKFTVSDLPAGIYLYRVKNNNNKTLASGKWIKM